LPETVEVWIIEVINLKVRLPRWLNW